MEYFMAVVILIGIYLYFKEPYIPYLRPLTIEGRIKELDFTVIRARLSKKFGWSEDRIRDAEADYRRFLSFIGKRRGEIVPWTADLDVFWHEHILCTRQYAKDCNEVFGRFIHHNPNIEESSEQYRNAILLTYQLLHPEEQSRNGNGSSSSASCSGSFGDGGGFGGGGDGGGGGGCGGD